MQSAKPLHVFLGELEEKAPLSGFGVRHVFGMGNVYRERGVKVAQTHDEFADGLGQACERIRESITACG